MSAAGLLRDRAELEALFGDLAVELARLGVTADVVMVGGAWMLWHSQRISTRDVDSARTFDADVTEAVNAVGARHGLREGWLNDNAAGFWPSGASLDDCEVVYEADALVVRTPGPEVVFVMKMYRADPQDREDMVLLWRLCGFETPEEAVHAFQDAYPHAPEDKYLVEYVGGILHDASPG